MIRDSFASVQPAYRAATAWLELRSHREHQLLGLMATLLIAAVVWYGLARPMIDARSDARARIETAAAQQSRLRLAGPAMPSVAALDGDLAQVVRSRAASLNLSPGTVTGEGRDVTIAVAGARYDTAMQLVSLLEGADGATVEDLRIESAGQPGLVLMTLRVTR